MTSSTNLVTTISGDALAVGENTAVSGTISVTTTDVGPVTRSTAEATFTATAQSPEGGDAYAVADTTATADGADLLITHSTNITGTGDSSGLTTMIASSTSLFALDIEAVDLPVGTISVEGATWHDDPCLTGIIEGNVATLDASAQAAGDNTLAEVDMSVMTTDVISSVSASAITIA
ncbi:hypothetical protein DES45_103377 [Microvirga subterranea]|uniref:Uncharacterized protein n=2 Tax=Microvirga subterranea TaxID=186651 RepID=A0A370HNG9_9HYPH|nr:hypothetical protein DES45_103377 [Microvirga subterranea]